MGEPVQLADVHSPGLMHGQAFGLFDGMEQSMQNKDTHAPDRQSVSLTQEQVGS